MYVTSPYVTSPYVTSPYGVCLCYFRVASVCSRDKTFSLGTICGECVVINVGTSMHLTMLDNCHLKECKGVGSDEVKGVNSDEVGSDEFG